MCVEPTYLPEIGPVACRYCWQCRANRVNDLVGRCIAEQNLSKSTYAVTLTYGDDLLPESMKANAATLVYKDFQNFMKVLRRHGYQTRYIVAGEYGSEKGRAHWHAVLFFSGKRQPEQVEPADISDALLINTPPGHAPKFTEKVALEERFFWKYWPHGFVFFQKPDYGGFSYCLKYALKNLQAEVAQGHLAMSKKPPLGHGWFMDMANDYVAQGLSPQTPAYSFREVFDGKRKRRKFWLQGRMREMFTQAYLDAYAAKHGGEYPFSEFVLDYEDLMVRRAFVMSDDEWRARLQDKIIPAKPPEPDRVEKGEPIYLTGYVMLPDEMILSRFSNGSVEINTKEGETWRVANESQLNRALEAAGIPAMTRARAGRANPPMSLGLRPKTSKGGRIGHSDRTPPKTTPKEKQTPRPRRLQL